MPYQVGYTLSKPVLPTQSASAVSGHCSTQKSGGVNFSDVLRDYQGISSEEMLSKLRERFSNVSFHTELTRDGIARLNRSESNTIQITDGMLKRMANDPNEYKWVTEKIERFLSGASEFSGMTDGTHQIGMSISEVGTLFWSFAGVSDLSETEAEALNQAWNYFMDSFLEWFRNRGENCTFEMLFDSKVA
ncbi:MAG: DUF6033 family protein [Oscillospiraceae bacterium]|nr:DUF6033 family protein [Oscillospiraceae bacterium]